MSLGKPPVGRWERLKNWWEGAGEEIEKDAKSRWYTEIDRSIVVTKRRAEFADYLRYILDDRRPVRFRMHALQMLIGNNATASGPKDDPNLAELLLIWNSMVALYWEPFALLLRARKEELMGIRSPGTAGVSMPVEKLEDMGRYIFAKHFEFRGVTLAELMYGEKDHVPQFTNVREVLPGPAPPKPAEGPGVPM